MYLVTRPLPKLATSANYFATAGLSACVVAVQDIQVKECAIDNIRSWLIAHAHGIIIVTSTTAANLLVKHINAPLDGHTFLCVGQSTGGILRSLSQHVIVPNNESSEGLLALPELKDCANAHVLLIKGEGGRTTIANALTTRHASVEAANIYTRVPLPHPRYSGPCDWSNIRGIVVTSLEQAEAFLVQFKAQSIATLPWLTVSRRIAEKLTNCGIKHVAVCPKASDVALTEWIQQNWE